MNRALRTIERYKMFGPGMRLGVAVSGGLDSTCLLHLLRELAPRWNLHLSVVHIEHGIRGDVSRADAEFVRDMAARFGLYFHLCEAHVASTGDNLEQAARRARQNFFQALISAGTLDRIATGHTRSDQAETVMYRLLRGAGLSGLRGVLPVTNEGVVRPFLDVDRAEIEAWMRERGIEWREDETNEQRTFARNRLRHDILPLLREAFNPHLDSGLAQLAELARDEEHYWNGLLPPVVNKAGAVFWRAEDLAAAHPAMARRTVRRIIENVRGDLRQIDFSHVEAILDMARSELGSGRVQLPGLDIFRSFDWLRVAPAGFDSGRTRDFSFPISVPGSASLPGDAGLVELELMNPGEKPECHDKVRSELDWKRLTFFAKPDAAGQYGAASVLLELRNWRPGDRYRPAGESRERKIKDFFQEARIPLWDRRDWPVLVLGGRIVWARRFGPATEFAALNADCKRVAIHEEPGH